MKTIHLPLLAIFLLASTFLLSQTSNIQQATSVNTDGSTPDPSAMLDVQSTTQGMLVPRMTTAQRTTVASPATGLLVFDTDTGGFWFFDGTNWVDLSSPNHLADADIDTKIQVEETADEDIIRFDVAGVEFAKMDGTTFHLEAPGNSLFIGTNAGQKDNGADNENTFIGVSAGQANTTGFINTFIGHNAGFSNTDGNNNTFIGQNAGQTNTGGSQNTFIGENAGFSNIDGLTNTFIGRDAGFLHSTGNSNTFIGQEAGRNDTTGSGNVFLGSDAGRNETSSNRLFIENTDSSTPLIYGEFDNNIVGVNGNLGIGSTSPESNLHVFKGTAGTVTANSDAVAAFENNNTAYLNLLTPNANASGIPHIALRGGLSTTTPEQGLPRKDCSSAPKVTSPGWWLTVAAGSASARPVLPTRSTSHPVHTALLPAPGPTVPTAALKRTSPPSAMASAR